MLQLSLPLGGRALLERLQRTHPDFFLSSELFAYLANLPTKCTARFTFNRAASSSMNFLTIQWSTSQQTAKYPLQGRAAFFNVDMNALRHLPLKEVDEK